jgi:hypothetical protein
MTRHRPPKHIRDKRKQEREKGQSEREKETPQSTIAITWKLIVGTVSGVGLLLGLVTAILSLLPRLSVSNLESLDPDDPFSTPFVVSNDGVLGINDVVLSCILVRLESATQHWAVEGFRSVGYAPTIPRLDPGEQGTAPCNPAVGLKASAADIEVVVSYRPDYVPWKKERPFRFVTVSSKDGKLHWIPQPYIRPKSQNH